MDLKIRILMEGFEGWFDNLIIEFQIGFLIFRVEYQLSMILSLTSMRCIRALFSVYLYVFCEVSVEVGASC